MENRFLKAMDERGERSGAALKRLYRAACKQVHPDTGGQYGRVGASESFIALRLDYEEAMRLLGETPAPADAVGNGKAREGRGAGTRNAQRRPGLPIALLELREACARLGELAGMKRCDPYSWNPDPEFIIGLLRKADDALPGLSGTAKESLPALFTVLSALSGDAARLRRYPGLMTRACMLYKALHHWRAYSLNGSAEELAACRTRLEELADPTIALVHSNAVAEVVAAFPTAAGCLMAVLGISPER